MSPTTTRAVVLRRQTASSGPVHDDFAIEALPLAPLRPGQVLVRNAYMSVDPSMRGRLEPTAPDGIDVYFDNVGGEQLVAALDSLRLNGRVALCGMISDFDPSSPRHQIGQLIAAVLKRLTIRGFIVRDHEDLRPEFETRIASWLHSGGANVGKMLVRLDPDA